MMFRVDPASGIGLADQIAAQVRGELAAGRLHPGDRLPPARQVAAGLDVNMHTVLRAYGTVRDEGLIDLRRGRGAVVRAEPESVALDGKVRDLAQAALRLGWTAEQAASAVHDAVARMTGHEQHRPGPVTRAHPVAAND